ncbi:MAG TPA: sugar phosphate isomerase/epimerase [Solirubrobacteraceae bacterium]|nr:sugar phosphate isomerase/epimerase [Solirubrobacteraceae bacterium]
MLGRLGLNVHRDAWPTPQLLCAYEDAGFAWVQLHTPPLAMLADRRHGLRHARAVRAALGGTCLRLLLHAPDDLSAGRRETDAALDGLLDYAAEAGAELIAYHGLNFAQADGPSAARLRERAQLEERSLIPLLQRAQSLGITFAIENLAPVYPGTRRQCHDALAVRDLVRRLASPAAGMLLDLGHLHITADATRAGYGALLEACAPDVVLFHAHDNLGARRRLDAPAVDPIRLDLHLPPGRGSLPWALVAATVAGHRAPVMLEIERSHRPPLDVLAADTLRLLGGPAAAPPEPRCAKMGR